MRVEDRPRTIPDLVKGAPFPVYGLNDHPLDLLMTSYTLGISHLSNLISTGLVFTSPRYTNSHISNRYSPKSQNFYILSIDAATEHLDREHMIFSFEGLSEDTYSNSTQRLFQLYSFSEEEENQAGDPLVWQGELALANTIFTGKMFSWNPPFQIATFLLKSEETILLGSAYGPSDKEVFQLLESLQVINHQDNLLESYQHDFEHSPWH